MALTVPGRVDDESMVAPDAGWFGEIYRQNLRSVWQMLRRLGVHEAGLDDATQDVFLTAFRRWRDFEGRSSVRTWLLGIALKVASEHRRRTRPSETLSVELPATGPAPDATVERKEQVHALLALLEQLPSEQRELLVLVETGHNLNTIYTRLRTARQRFQALLGDRR